MAFGRCPPDSFADLQSELLGGQVLLTRVRGQVTGLLVEQRFDQFRSELSGVAQPIWIVELEELTGFDKTAVMAAARWFSAFKDRGGLRIIAVAPMPAARMALATLAFAVHAKISNCATLSEAYELAGLGAVEVRPSLYSLTPKGESPGYK